jgi:NRAMP (natural resistance-associated macrophage protein)-like metal ion transporter
VAPATGRGARRRLHVFEALHDECRGGGVSSAKDPAAAKVPRRGSGSPRVDPKRPPDPGVAAILREANPLKRALIVLGPGLVTGASDDDPSGVGTYAQAGASYGYATLWTTLFMFPMMSAVQYISAKVGLVSGRGLAGVLREHYPRWVLYPALAALVVANTLNAGADIGAIAAAINLLVPIPAFVFVVPVGLGIVAIQVFGSYALISRVFKWLALVLLAYLATALFTHPDVGKVLAGTLVPTVRLDPAYIGLLVALLGTTISPYLFFWQASQEVDEQIKMGRRRLWQRKGANSKELRFALWDTIAGMAFSELVAYFIILTTGATLFVAGKHDIGSATEAADALRPLAGNFSAALLAVGLIGAGVLAVPVLTGSAAYGVAETFGWSSGLDSRPARAPEFYAVIVAATAIGVAINFVGLNPITALVFSAVINGLLAAPLVVILMLVSNNRRAMGARTNGRLLNTIGWVTAAVMGVAAIALILTTILG